MFTYKFKIYINNIWFDSLYGVDYYYDKRIFFTSGAKQFFTIYQILKTGDFKFTIIEETSGERIEIETTKDFEYWVERHFGSFLKCLDNVDWNNHPEDILK